MNKLFIYPINYCNINMNNNDDNDNDANIDNGIMFGGGNKKKHKKTVKNDSDKSDIITLLKENSWSKIVKIYPDPREIIINGNNLLHIACVRGIEQVINYYTSKNPELIFVANKEGNTCGHLLLQNGHEFMAKKMISKYPKLIHFLNNNNDSLIDLVMREPEIMNWLVNLIDPKYFEEIDDSKVQGLKTMIEMIKLNKGRDIYHMLINNLINKGFKLSQTNSILPLIVASRENKPEIVDLLIKNGSDPNTLDVNNMSPLIYATMNRSYGSVGKLLEHGANINYAGPEGDHFPLNIALNNQDTEMVDIFLSHAKLNYDFRDRNLETPIYNALLNNTVIKPSQMYKIIYESNLNTKNIDGTTPIDLLKKTKLNIQNYRSILEKKKIYITHDKNIKIRFPKINAKVPNIGVFNSDIIHNAIYTISLLQKHDFQIPLSKNTDNNEYMLYRTKEGKLIKNIIDTYVECFPSLLTHLFLWKSSDLYYYNYNIDNSVKKLLKSDKRFIVIKLSLIPNPSSTHANLLIYDKKTNVLERFEPYGAHSLLDDENLNKFLEKIGKQVFSKTLTYKSPQHFLSETKFQIVSSDSDPENKIHGDPMGYCLAWCFWYLEIRMNNPDVDSVKLTQNAFDKLGDGGNLLEYIRKYSYTLDKMKNEFLEKCNIKSDRYYAVQFTDTEYDDILRNINNELKKYM